MTVQSSAVQQRIRAEPKELFDPSRFNFPAAVSLTMKKRVGGYSIDLMAASENFRYFRNRLNNIILGSRAKRHGGKLKMVAIIESNADGRLHYHAMIDRPYYCSFDRFRHTIIDQWKKTPFGYRQIDVQDAADAGWVDYIIKPQQKTSLLESRPAKIEKPGAIATRASSRKMRPKPRLCRLRITQSNVK